MEENIPRRKRDLRDVSHYFFSSEEELAQSGGDRSADLSSDDLKDSQTNLESRSIVEDIKKSIGIGASDPFDPVIDSDSVCDQEESESAYETIEKETCALLKSESSETSFSTPENTDTVCHNASTRFAPLLKTISLVPLGKESYSLLLHVYFAKVLLHSPYKVYIISTNPHTDSWNYLERTLALPSIVDVDLSKGLRTFSLFDSVDLIIVDPLKIDSFFAVHEMHDGDSNIFDSQGKQLLFLVDFITVEDRYKERLASLVDCFLLLTSSQSEDLRETYKAIKTYISVSPQAQYKCIINEKADFYLEEFLQREFNNIVGQFLKRTVDFIGFCDSDIFVHGNNLKWKAKDKEHVFTVETDFLADLKKEEWSEDMLRFYQTVISNVKF